MHLRPSNVLQLLLCLLCFVSSLQPLNAAPTSIVRSRSFSLLNALSAAVTEKSTVSSSSGGNSAAAARTDIFYPGDFVGVRVKAYTPGSKIDIIHPGVVVGGPTSDLLYDVAMISKKLPGDPPQKPISTYQTGTGMEGNISLLPVRVPWNKMKAWRQKNTGTGQQQPSLEEDMLDKLLKHIEVAEEGQSSSASTRGARYQYGLFRAKRTKRSGLHTVRSIAIVS